MFEMTRRVIADGIGAVKRTPVEVALGLGTACFLSAVIADAAIEPETVGKVLLSVALFWCVTFATSALSALKVFNQQTRWLLTAVFGVAATAYGYFLDPRAVTELWRFGFLALASVTAVMLVPVAARMGDATASERFWRFNMRLGFRFSIAGTYAGLLFGGIAVALAAIAALFDVNIGSEVYGHVAVFILIGGGSLLAAGGLADIVRIDRSFDEESLIWFGRLGTFLFIPLLLLYLAILYAYLGKVFFTGDIPSNVLSPLALGAGILGYLGLFVLQPFMQRPDHRPLAAVLKAFPAAFIPVVPLGLWAVSERVMQYGWTEFRYARFAALICLGVFSIIGAYRWIRRQPFSLTTGPAILSAVAVLAAVGPWGASSVSERSQRTRLVETARAAGALKSDGRLASAEVLSELPSEAGATLRSTLDYLGDAHGPESVRSLMPAGSDYTAEELRRPSYLIGLDSHHADRGTYAALYTGHGNSFQLPRGGTVYEVSVGANNTEQFEDLTLTLKDQKLSLTTNDHSSEVDLASFTRLLSDDGGSNLLPAEKRTVPIMREGVVVGTLVVRNLNYERDDGWRPNYFTGIVVLYPE